MNFCSKWKCTGKRLAKDRYFSMPINLTLETLKFCEMIYPLCMSQNYPNLRLYHTISESEGLFGQNDISM